MLKGLILGLSVAILAGSIIMSYIYRSKNETARVETKRNDSARLSNYKSSS